MKVSLGDIDCDTDNTTPPLISQIQYGRPVKNVLGSVLYWTDALVELTACTLCSHLRSKLGAEEDSWAKEIMMTDLNRRT